MRDRDLPGVRRRRREPQALAVQPADPRFVEQRVGRERLGLRLDVGMAQALGRVADDHRVDVGRAGGSQGGCAPSERLRRPRHHRTDLCPVSADGKESVMPRASSQRGSGSTAVAPESGVDLTTTEATIPAPRPLTEIEHAAIATSTTRADTPTLLPPSARTGSGAATVSVGAATGTWTSGVKINALWSQYSTRNAYMSVEGVGWVKIYNATDAAFLALTTLASQAKQTQSQIVYRTEADGLVHEIYLW